MNFQRHWHSWDFIIDLPQWKIMWSYFSVPRMQLVIMFLVFKRIEKVCVKSELICRSINYHTRRCLGVHPSIICKGFAEAVTQFHYQERVASWNGCVSKVTRWQLATGPSISQSRILYTLLWVSFPFCFRPALFAVCACTSITSFMRVDPIIFLFLLHTGSKIG